MWRFILVLLLFTGACSLDRSIPPIKLIGEAQGTYYSIIYYDSLQRDLQFEIDSLLDAFDQSVSLWVPGSILSRVNNNADDLILDEYFINNFNLSKRVAEETNGAFDFTVGPLVKAWGFGYNHKKQVDSIIVDSLLKIVGYTKVAIVNDKVIKQNLNTTFDFNAIAQGYSVDMIGDFFNSMQIENYLIDIGGEVMARGNKANDAPWKVGIEKPAKDKNTERDLTAIIKLYNQSVATSGNYRKFFEKDGVKYSHTINPSTGYPASNNLLSVSIVANNTALADAYATACMVMGLEESIMFVENRNDLEAFFIFSDDNGNYNVYATAGFSRLIISEFK
ncbi:MAG: FAD:protein FMN transferase, partial [Bacteroidota bacterium]